MGLGDLPAGLVFEAVVVAAGQGEILVAGWSAVGVVGGVVDVGGSCGHAAAGCAAGAVTGDDPSGQWVAGRALRRIVLDRRSGGWYRGCRAACARVPKTRP